MTRRGQTGDDLEVSPETLAAFESQLGAATAEPDTSPSEADLRIEHRHALAVALFVVLGVALGLATVFTYVF